MITADEIDGVDYGRVPFARCPNGEPVFGEAEMITVEAQPGPGMPGYAMLRSWAGGDESGSPLP